MHISIDELLLYTDHERSRWEEWFRQNGEEVLATPIVGEAEVCVGQLVMHIFGPELQSVQRLRNEPVTEYKGLPWSTIEAVFGFGLRTRKAMRDFIEELRPDDWRRPVNYGPPDGGGRPSVRELIAHSLIHEIEHWAQIACLIRERGFAVPAGDGLLARSALD